MSDRKLSPKGRIGRAKLACWGTTFLMIPRLLSTTYPVGILVLPVTFPLYIFTILKRLRDINASPWWVLIAWIPLLNIPLLFIPGTKGENRFGQQPEISTRSEFFFAMFLPVAFTGIIASTVIPNAVENYENYKQRAEAGQQDPNKASNPTP